jgi:5-methylcytosine-specific restriction endonuclease McrA
MFGEPIVKGEPLDMDRPTIDHVVPVSYGGTHTKDNVRACCFGCNTNKGVMSVDEFRMSTERFNEAMAQRQQANM